jgi:hypothetical protein
MRPPLFSSALYEVAGVLGVEEVWIDDPDLGRARGARGMLDGG